jgi:hypothetical protein
MAQSSEQPRQNPKAEQAFLDYVWLGPSRSLAALADRYQSAPKPPPTKRLKTLKDWSARYHWRARIAAAVSARTEALLSEATELDAETFAVTSRHLRKQIESFAESPNATIQIRESVRKQLPKGVGATSVTVGVNLTLSVEHQQIVERIATERGLTIDEVMRELDEIIKAPF